MRFTDAFGGERGDWYYWGEDVDRFALDGIRCRYSGWSPTDWQQLARTDRGDSVGGSDGGVTGAPDDARGLRADLEIIREDLDLVKRKLQSWQDAWASQQQAAEYRRAADEASSRATAHVNQALTELATVDDNRRLEIYHLNEALAAGLMPDSTRGLG